MSRPLACSVLFVLLHIAPLNLAPLAAAQEPERWGDELPPAPEFSAMPVAPMLDSVRWPAPPLHRPPAQVRAVYVNAWAFGGRRFRDLVALADRTEINAFVIDVKDDTGYLTYRSGVPHGDPDRRQPAAPRPGYRGAPPAPARARHSPDRPDRRGQGSAAGLAQAGVVGSPRERRPLAGSTGLRLGGRLQRFGLDLRGPARGRGRAHGLRRGAVRLRALPRRAREPPGQRRLRRTARGRDQAAGRRPQSPSSSATAPGRSACRSPSTSSVSPPAPAPTWGSGSTGRISSPPPTWCCRWSTPATTSAGCTTSSARTIEPYQLIRRAMQDALRRSAPLGQDRRGAALPPGLHPGLPPIHARPWSGSRSGPRRSWGSGPGCSGIRGAPTTRASSVPSPRRWG